MEKGYRMFKKDIKCTKKKRDNRMYKKEKSKESIFWHLCSFKYHPERPFARILCVTNPLS